MEERALSGKTEYQKGNIEAALDVFEGIDVATITPRIKATLAARENSKRQSQNLSVLPLSIQAASLLLEAIFLKAKSLQHLGRFKDAAQSCRVVLDIVESSLPEGLPDNLHCQETITQAVELLPELWKLADCLHESVLSYRRALLGHWNLDAETTAKIQKEFAVFLLYGGGEAGSLNLRSQMGASSAPRNSTEEAILLLMVLLQNTFLERVRWDASILDHLTFALSVSGDLESLARAFEGLLPGTIGRGERYYALALCYHGIEEDMVALNLLRRLLHSGEEPANVPGLLMASKICGKLHRHAAEGAVCARRALECCGSERGRLLGSSAMFLLGTCLSEHSKLALSDSERAGRQSEAVRALEAAGRMTEMGDACILYHLCLEHAEQRKLDAALHYAKLLLGLENGSSIRGWLLLARILSAHKRFADAETIIIAALDQTGKWDQGVLLRTKAKLEIAQGHVKSAIDTYTLLLGILQVQIKCFGAAKKPHKGNLDPARQLELEVWHDLASIYINLSQWSDAEICLSKSKAISPCSSSRCHLTGVLREQKGLYEEALVAYESALDVDPTHAPSLVGTAMLLSRLCRRPNEVSRSLLMDALRIDRMNSSAWHNLGLLYRADAGSSASSSSSIQAAECFQAAAFLKDSEPVEPFR